MSKEAIVIVLDIGHATSQDTEDSKPGFLENAKQCISMILKRKIFSNSKDEVALILVGSNETENSLDYSNVEVKYSLQLPSWGILEYLEKELKGTKVSADWLDAIVVGMQVLKEETEGKKFAEKKLVLFTDLDSPVSEDQVEVIIKAVASEAVNLIVIGPDTNLNVKEEPMDEDDYDNEKKYQTNGSVKSKTVLQQVGETLLSKILNEVGGVICSFSEAVPQLMFFQKRNVKPMPFNVIMDIGPDIKIAVSGYRKITPSTLPSWKTTSAKEKGIRIENEKSYIRQDENQTVVDQEDVIDGFSFGTTLVPYSDVDKTMMSYKSEKCLSVLGFTKASNIPRHLFMGNGVLYFTAQRDDENAAVALSSLIHALQEQDLVAIAKKVYRNNSSPLLGCMFPKISSSFECLVFVELPYSEDMRECVFTSLASDSNKPTDKQLSSIDALIDNMDLTAVKNEFDENVEAFKSESILNPYHQYIFSCLAHRAMDEDSEIPPVPDYVKNLLKSPFLNKPAYKLSLEEIKRQFPLTEVKQKQTKKRAAEFFKKDKEGNAADGPSDDAVSDEKMTNLVGAIVLEVGSVKPDIDFKILLDRGEPFNKVCRQMENVIHDLVIRSFGTDNFDKAQSALKTLRSACVDQDPSVFNDWFETFRSKLFERGKKAFWDLIVEDKISLITSHESPKSILLDDDAKKFLQYMEVKEEEAPPEDDEMDADDLLDEM